MKRHSPVLAVVVILAVTVGAEERRVPAEKRNEGPAPAADVQSGDWTAVRALVPGSQVRIWQEGGRSTEGILGIVAEEQIAVLIDKGSLSLARPSIRRIDLASGRQTRKGALIGLLIGAAGGTLQGALTTKSSRGVWTASLAAGWGGMGALFGALDGSRRTKYVSVYEVRAARE